MTISFPNDTEEIIDAIRGAIGRLVTFYIPGSGHECTACGLDPVTGGAIDPFCTVCSGLGYIYTYSGCTVSGHVTWGHSELLNWIPGGQYYDGEARVQVKYTVANLEAVENAKWVEVDGKEMVVSKKILRGVPQINRILVDLKERDND